jgi:ketosteroid isomerase-like protein
LALGHVFDRSSRRTQRRRRRPYNAGDLDGLVALYEESAVLEGPDGRAVGRDQIKAFYADLRDGRPQFTPGHVLPALVSGDLALTTTQIGLTASVEIARRQADGSWRWLADRPDVLRSSTGQ